MLRKEFAVTDRDCVCVLVVVLVSVILKVWLVIQRGAVPLD